MEFASNNSYHSSIRIASYEALYGQRCRIPLCWDQVEERKLISPELVQVTSENVQIIKERLKVARDR